MKEVKFLILFSMALLCYQIFIKISEYSFLWALLLIILLFLYALIETIEYNENKTK